jgi:lipoyl(octanoyl) transferase
VQRREARGSGLSSPRPAPQVAIRTLGSLGLEGEREPGATGVWVGGAKACALGVKVSRWLTYHGLALNVCTEMEHWRGIVPCGLHGREVASVETLLASRGEAAVPRALLLDRAATEMLRHFGDVFGAELRAPTEDDLTLERHSISDSLSANTCLRL